MPSQPMDINKILETLAQATEQTASNSVENATNRAFWIQAQMCYKQASLEDKCNFVDALDARISESSVLFTSPGLELFIPTLWESLVLSHECTSHAQTIFRLLSRLISNHMNVQFGDSMNHILATSLHFVWTNPLDTLEDLKFITALITHARKESISVQFALSKMLATLSPSLSDSDQHVWKRLLLIAHLIDELQPIVSRQALPSWSTPVASFVIQCLQVKRVTQSSSCRYVLFELLAALCRYTHDSLDWLRPLCVQSDSGQPFVVILTATIVEMKLGLSQSTNLTELSSVAPVTNNDCTRAITQTRVLNAESKQLAFVPNPTKLRCAVLKNSSELLRLGLLDLKTANSSSEAVNSSTTCLAQLMSDESAQGIWLQLIDLGEAIREYFMGSSEYPSENRIPQAVHEAEDLNASILSTYLTWLELYFETHHDEILANSCAEEAERRLLELGQRLMKESLQSVEPILWLQISRNVFLSTDPSKCQTVAERFLSSLEFFSSLFPGLSIFPFSYTTDVNGSRITLGRLASRWLWSMWTDPDSCHVSDKKAILNLLTLINNSWLGSLASLRDLRAHADLFQWLRDPACFASRVLDTDLPQPTEKDVDIRLDVQVEVLIMCVLTITLRCAPTSGSSNSIDHLSADLPGISGQSVTTTDVTNVAHKFLNLLDRLAEKSDEDSAAFQALHQRIRKANQRSTEILQLLAHVPNQ